MDNLQNALNESGKYLSDKTENEILNLRLGRLVEKRRRIRILKIFRMELKAKIKNKTVKKLILMRVYHTSINDFKTLDKINTDEKGWNKI